MSGIWGQHQEGCDPRNAEDRAKFLASNLNRTEEKFAAQRLAAAESVPQSHTQSAPLHLPVLAEARTTDRAAREMLGPTVFNLGHEFSTLCAEQGCPMDKELLHGTGEYASVRRPKASAAASIRPSADLCQMQVYDINQKILIDCTSQTKCTRDGRIGSALIDLLEEMYGSRAVGRATMMLS